MNSPKDSKKRFSGRVDNYVKYRLLSSSYTPLPNESNHDALMQELLRIFDLYNENGMITLFYDTELFYGEIGR
jgi:hypothetical protein